MLFTILYNGDMSAKEAVVHFIITTIVFILSLALHELAHGFAAYKMGDDTPKKAGRLSLNPFNHLSTSGFLMFIIIGVGWAKPMPTNPLKYKKYRKGQRLVSIAGVCVNFLLGLISAVILAILFACLGLELVLTNTALYWLYVFLSYMMLVNSCLFMFNMIPLFPLDGFNFVVSFIKKPESKYLKFNFAYGIMLLYGIIIFSLVLELFIGINIFDWLLRLIYDWVFLPIAGLGV